MGYHSTYEMVLYRQVPAQVGTTTGKSLSKLPEQDERPLIKEFLTTYPRWQSAIDEDGSSMEPDSGDGIEEDVLSFSTKHPDVVVMLQREGGLRFDVARLYFKDGKRQECWQETTFPPFDPELLE